MSGFDEIVTDMAGAMSPTGSSDAIQDRPNRRKVVTSSAVTELVGPAVAAFAVVWVVFSLAGLSAPFGMFVCWLIFFTTFYGLVTWRLHGILAAKDRLGTVYVWSGASIALLPLVAIISYVLIRGLPVVLNHFPHFLTADMSQGADGNAPISQAGVGAAIVGSIEQVGLATLITVPIAVLTASYFTESRSVFSRGIRTVVDAMTGTPSIIAGLFIYLFWVQPRHQNGVSGFAAALALCILMLPIVARSAEEVLKIVPGSLREAALALGAPQWRVVMRVVLPTARTGIITAVILGVARAVGETAPVLFTAGGSSYMNVNPFHGSQDDLPLRMKELIFSPGTNGTAEAWGAGLVLVVMVLLLFVIARLLGSIKPGRRLWRRPRSKEAAAS